MRAFLQTIDRIHQTTMKGALPQDPGFRTWDFSAAGPLPESKASEGPRFRMAVPVQHFFAQAEMLMEFQCSLQRPSSDLSQLTPCTTAYHNLSQAAAAIFLLATETARKGGKGAHGTNLSAGGANIVWERAEPQYSQGKGKGKRGQNGMRPSVAGMHALLAGSNKIAGCYCAMQRCSSVVLPSIFVDPILASSAHSERLQALSKRRRASRRRTGLSIFTFSRLGVKTARRAMVPS